MPRPRQVKNIKRYGNAVPKILEDTIETVLDQLDSSCIWIKWRDESLNQKNETIPIELQLRMFRVFYKIGRILFICLSPPEEYPELVIEVGGEKEPFTSEGEPGKVMVTWLPSDYFDEHIEITYSDFLACRTKSERTLCEKFWPGKSIHAGKAQVRPYPRCW